MKKDICIIDDDKIYQLIIKKVVERTSEFDSMCFYDDGIEAIEIFKSPEYVLPEIILLDINMPQMDGWQFLDNLIALRPNFHLQTIIYIVTSSIAHSDRDKAESYKEVSGFLSKPLSVEKLKEIAVKHRK
ncbi:response regulator receiver domain-containing protein [Gillisia sp. Hel_I_86]|uniref:response regulator n=1 Tax=Gillisia sp. Hel_I_86 TaxID=1249981 RepID=UPI00119C7491|nr:response regulator [Gillisia sp. Hel_I_86]TVZ26787.1 response regulator receiver domain-containing protein [Gillisia sp. Hel_I_86]